MAEAKKPKSPIKKVKKKKYRSSKTFRQLMRRANKRLTMFGRNNVTSNSVRLYQNLIKSFNKKYGISGDNTFNINKWYTKEEQKEIRALIKSIYMDPETSLREWKKTYRKIKDNKIDEYHITEDEDKQQLINLNFFQKIDEKFGIEDLQDYIEWSDTMNRFKSSDIIGKILDSDQYEDLVSLADDTGYSEEFNIDELIIDEYKKTGKTFVSLYNHVFDILMNYEKYGTTELEE